MRAIVTVWGLPEMGEEELKHLHLEIVEECAEHPILQVQKQQDMQVWFPPDLMKHGLGTDISVTVEPQPDRARSVESSADEYIVFKTIADMLRDRIWNALPVPYKNNAEVHVEVRVVERTFLAASSER